MPSQTFAAHPGPGHGVSPLPSRPYSRLPSAQQTPRLSTGLITDDDLIGSDQDALVAFGRGLTTSPLERIQDRASAYLDRIAAGMRACPMPMERPTTPAFQHQVTDVDAPQTYQRNNAWRASAQPRPPSSGQDSWNSAPTHQRRGAPAARAGQRSSENMPVGVSSQEQRTDRTTQAQPGRVAFRPRPNPPSSGAHM